MFYQNICTIWCIGVFLLENFDIINYTLKSFNSGQITLPKKWRDKFATKNFVAVETI